MGVSWSVVLITTQCTRLEGVTNVYSNMLGMLATLVCGGPIYI